MDAATALDGESNEAETHAAELTAPAHYSPKQPQTKAAITDEAERRVDQAEVVTSADSVIAKARSLRERIGEIRARL